MDSNIFSKKFNIFYSKTYKKINLKDKAFKDVVGHHYEQFRKDFYKSCGFSISKLKKIGGYKPDIIVEKDGVIEIIEEDKGHYVDSCFLGRAIRDFAKVINFCLESEKPVPLFILSCPTKMNNFSKVFDEEVELFRSDIKEMLKTNFIYVPLCNHGRIPSNRYFKTEESCFKLDEERISFQIELLKKL
jgi:hypothetical protein